MSKPCLSLAILCGGASQRLGCDKGLYKPLGDESLVVRAIRMLHGSFVEILVVVKDGHQAVRYEAELENLASAVKEKVRVVADAKHESLPYAAMTGLKNSLENAAHPVVVMAVDQVGLRDHHMQDLCSHYSEQMSHPVCFSANEQVIPFPSLWTKQNASLLMQRSSNQKFSIKEALLALNAKQICKNIESAHGISVNTNTKEEITRYFGQPLFDAQNRRMHYLRFSLTEACNMSCTYCLPDGFPEWYRHKARMSMDKIETMLVGFRRLGFRKVRFTGGEPTVHPQCLAAVRFAANVGFEEISLTTNGLLIEDIKTWKESGLTSLNVSLDSLDPETFEKITKSKKVNQVIALIEASSALGLKTKINTVLLRSVNFADVRSLVEFASQRKVTLRFIELMPTGLNQSFYKKEHVSGKELEPILSEFGYQPSAARSNPNQPYTGGPETVYINDNFPGRIGLINPLSCNFCSACNRLRVTAKGALRLCLFSEKDLPLNLDSASALEQQVRGLVSFKKPAHNLENLDFGNVDTFRVIGG